MVIVQVISKVSMRQHNNIPGLVKKTRKEWQDEILPGGGKSKPRYKEGSGKTEQRPGPGEFDHRGEEVLEVSGYRDERLEFQR